MKEKTLPWVLLWLQVLLLLGCATTRLETEISPDRKIVARVFPEVELTTAKGEVAKGKLIRFEDQTLTLLPFPYWGVDSARVPLSDIGFIKITDRKSSAGRAFLGGFGISFIIFGAIGAAGSEYDEDYKATLGGSALGAAIVGGISSLIGVLVDVGHRTKYDFQEMPDSKKIQSLRSIMGAKN